MSKSRKPLPDMDTLYDLKSGKKDAPSATSASIAPSAKGANVAPGAISANFQKTGILIRTEYLEKLRDLAYWDRRSIKDVLDEALKLYLSEKDIKPRKTE